VTHDLRTPLATIKASVTSMLGDGVHDPTQERELLETVLEETDRLNRLVGNIVDLARVRAGALVPAKELTSIEDVLESVLHRLAPRHERVSIRTLVRPDLPDVMIDPVQIDQVLTNILENAVRFSPPGGEILVAVTPWRDGVQVRVSDRGPGVAPEDRERIFEPFYRPAGTREDGAGVGLGLALVRQIARRHGGDVRCLPRDGGGTCFEVELGRRSEPRS
jgi:two-component system sensor histidine kinase KdpD